MNIEKHMRIRRLNEINTLTLIHGGLVTTAFKQAR